MRCFEARTRALRAMAAEYDINVQEVEPVALVLGKAEAFGTDRVHIAERPAGYTEQMMVGGCDVGVITLRTVAGRDLADFAHPDEFVHRVVDGGEANFGQEKLGAAVYRVGGEMDVFAGEDFGDDAPLCRQAPPAGAKALQEFRNGVASLAWVNGGFFLSLDSF